MSRVLVVCPGRGSYGAGQLGTLARLAERKVAPSASLFEPKRRPWREALANIDAWCAAHSLPTISALDSADRYRANTHRRADVASVLTTSLSYLDYLARRADGLGDEDWQPVAVVGNSLGWYTALAVAGAISLEDALRIVATTGGYQRAAGQVGAQLIYPLVDDSWRRPLDPLPLQAAMQAATAVGFVASSINLGGLMVFAGDTAAMDVLRQELPIITRGRATYPMMLAGHSAFHSPLLSPMAEAAQQTLADVTFRAPDLPMIDGNGDSWRPIYADPSDLRDYTLQAQITTPYNFAASVAVAVQEYAPDRILLLGPGGSLGGAIGQILAQLGWRGIRDKAGFTAQQRGDRPMLWTAEN